jgi:TrmH family RNA methyltransferase
MIVGTSPNAKRDYHRVRYDRPVILYLGSEKRGMAEERQSRCDLMVKIPMVGRSDSLNVGVAGSVMLYELFNQKRNVRATRR